MTYSHPFLTDLSLFASRYRRGGEAGCNASGVLSRLQSRWEAETGEPVPQFGLPVERVLALCRSLAAQGKGAFAA